VDDVNRAESVLTRPRVQNVLLVWYTLLLLDDSLPLVEHNILLRSEPKMEVACSSETLVPTYMLHNLNTILNPFRSCVEHRLTVGFSCSTPMSEDV
jgi:hypothetical protein